jgi:hypothetical protein
MFRSITLGISAILASSGLAAAQDYSQEPSFGSVTLSVGFAPDPHSRNLTAGGNIRAETRFSSCRGSIANAPDYSVYYTAGSLPLIFSVDSDSDTTLVINGPDTRWYCDDDGADEPLNPLVRFDNPQSGRYDIWVGTYSQGAGVPATLFVSELSEHTRSGSSGSSGRYNSSSSGGGANRLDIFRDARFGNVSLGGGFLPDPFDRSVTAGGSISVREALSSRSGVEGFCAGFVTNEPTLQLNYSGGSDLHIYTDGAADTTLAINGPDGTWYCNDDAVGTDAGISFPQGTNGTFDIYVGTFSGEQRQTTLRVSEISVGFGSGGY